MRTMQHGTTLRLHKILFMQLPATIRYRLSDHGGVPCLTGGDTHAAADIICYMNGYKDNRREKFFTKSEWAGQGYVGMRRGIVIP